MQTGSSAVDLPDFVIPSKARDLQFAARCRSFASLGMTIHERCRYTAPDLFFTTVCWVHLWRGLDGREPVLSLPKGRPSLHRFALQPGVEWIAGRGEEVDADRRQLRSRKLLLESRIRSKARFLDGIQENG
jgi:hypothetical protein